MDLFRRDIESCRESNQKTIVVLPFRILSESHRIGRFSRILSVDIVQQQPQRWIDLRPNDLGGLPLKDRYPLRRNGAQSVRPDEKHALLRVFHIRGNKANRHGKSVFGKDNAASSLGLEKAMDIIEKCRTLLQEHQIVVEIVLPAEPMFTDDPLHCRTLREGL